jgi:hypothetical protein
MKKLFALMVLVTVIAFSANAISADYISIPTPGSQGMPRTFQATIPLWGNPGLTKTVNVDNVARTIRSIYERGGGTYLAGGAPPIGALITCESKNTRWAFGGTTPTTTVGNLFPADYSWHIPGPWYMSSGQAISTVSSDNVTCQMTPEY